MMKKIFVLALALCLALAASSCAFLQRDGYQTTVPATEPDAGTSPSGSGTEPPATEPATEPEDDEREALLALSEEALYQRLYQPALELWQVVHTGAYQWKIDYSVSFKAEAGYSYYLVDDETMTSMEKLVALYREHFSRRLTQELMDLDFIVEKDSHLWCVAIGKGGNLYYANNTTFALSDSGDTLTLTVTSDFIKDIYLMAIEDYNNIPAEYLETRSQDLTLVREDGRWVFDSFQAPDLIGW